MAVGPATLTHPEVRAGLSLARLPAWFTWGAAIGLVQIFAIATVGPLGVSTAYPQVVGIVGSAIDPAFAQEPYLKMVGVSVGWEIMLVLGLMLGALGAAYLAKRNGGGAVAPVCVTGFEQSRTRKYLRAFVGGFLFIFGARMAGGCTSGHLLSGTSQMAISGLVFGLAVFASGYLIARFFFREPAAAGN